MRYSIWYSELRDRIVMVGFDNSEKACVTGEHGFTWDNYDVIVNELIKKEYEYIGWY